ncbi:MAG TPA: ABC transporter ATP-binding protein [Thermoguttaceae bacterium]|nr:ABC transporter ATP-binding protein [Thermoguttaceae bacterium]
MMIELDHVTKLYGLVLGVNDLNVSLQPGAYGLVGPNGSGKTTLLRLLTGQLRPSMGRVRVLGQNPWNNAVVFRKLGYCPQEDGFPAHITAWEWIYFLLTLAGLDSREARRRTEEALAMVDLADVQHRRIAAYSRGMRQRVKLAQALANDPELLILDEPFSGLDPVGRHQMIRLLRQREQAGKGILIATHLLQDVEAVARQFLLICGGRLLASGDAEEIFSLLEDLPKEIHIRTDAPRQLARDLVALELADSVRLLGDDRLWVASRNPGQLYAQLPRIIQQGRVSVWEIAAADSSLQSLFDILLKIHYGVQIRNS